MKTDNSASTVASDGSSSRFDRLLFRIGGLAVALLLIAALLIFLFSPIYDYFYKSIDMSVLRPERHYIPGTPFILPLLPLLLFAFVTLGLSTLSFLALKADRANEFCIAGTIKLIGIYIALYITVALSGILAIIVWNFSGDAFHKVLELCAALRMVPYAWVPFSLLNLAGLYLFLRGDWSTLSSPSSFLEGAAALVLICALLTVPFYWFFDVIAGMMFYFVSEKVVSGPLNALFSLLGLVVIFSATVFFPGFAIVRLATNVHRRLRRR